MRETRCAGGARFRAVFRRPHRHALPRETKGASTVLTGPPSRNGCGYKSLPRTTVSARTDVSERRSNDLGGARSCPSTSIGARPFEEGTALEQRDLLLKSIDSAASHRSWRSKDPRRSIAVTLCSRERAFREGLLDSASVTFTDRAHDVDARRERRRSTRVLCTRVSCASHSL